MAQQSSFGGGSDQSGKIKDQVADQFNKAAGQAEDLADRVTEHGHEANERAQELVGNFTSTLDRSVREQPMVALIFAGIAGFLIGAIWRS
jgi:ElaB/YqjD/DUF883 family membrane-anchored ribosome-binding protein